MFCQEYYALQHVLLLVCTDVDISDCLPKVSSRENLEGNWNFDASLFYHDVIHFPRRPSNFAKSDEFGKGTGENRRRLHSWHVGPLWVETVRCQHVRMASYLLYVLSSLLEPFCRTPGKFTCTPKHCHQSYD